MYYENSLDCLFRQQIEDIQAKYRKLSNQKNIKQKQYLYELMVQVNREVPTEQEYLNTYNNFDR